MMFKLEPRPDLTKALAAVLALTITAFAGLAVAGSAGSQAASPADSPSTRDSAALQKLQAKRIQIRTLVKQLQSVQEQATKADPDLQAAQKDYRELMIETMKDESFDPEAEINRMRTLQSELQDGAQLDEQERQDKMQALRQKEQKFRRRRKQAMQVDEVKVARDELNKKMENAMQEQDPGVQDKLAQLTRLKQEYQQLLRKVLEQRQDNG